MSSNWVLLFIFSLIIGSVTIGEDQIVEQDQLGTSQPQKEESVDEKGSEIKSLQEELKKYQARDKCKTEAFSGLEESVEKINQAVANVAMMIDDSQSRFKKEIQKVIDLQKTKKLEGSDFSDLLEFQGLLSSLVHDVEVQEGKPVYTKNEGLLYQLREALNSALSNYVEAKNKCEKS